MIEAESSAAPSAEPQSAPPGGARPPGAPSQPSTLIGHLKVRASADLQGRTFLREQSFRAPFHIGKGYWDGQVMQLRVVNPTAGILAGDRLELAVDVDPKAALAILTPAATRAFMMTSGVAACEQRFTVAAGAWLEYAPEPIFPHTQSDYAQSTRLELFPGAEAYYAEALAPGRVGRGESWAWRRLRLRLDVTLGAKLLFRERLDSSGADFARLAAFYRLPEAWFATVTMYSDRLRDDSPIWEGVRAFGAPTRLAPGLYLVRVIAAGSVALRDQLAGLRHAAAAFFPALGTDLRRQ